MATSQKPIVCVMNEQALTSSSAPSDRFVYSKYFKPITLQPFAGPVDPDDIEVQRALLSSELGYLFLDRTRIRPTGFAIGEHVHSLSLAPGEEVVMEQRTFSKRETTFEEQSEQEKQYDLEMSSTLSTELAEGLDRERSHGTQSTFAVGGSAGAEYKGASVEADVSYSESVSDASSQARKRSVKSSSTSSSRVASKYRAMHKTTFRVATEDRFEMTSKRVIKNPNQYSSLDVHYFKILRRLELRQERYGARLCWAPAVEDPASEVAARIAKRREEIVSRALAGVTVPPRPDAPVREDKPKVFVTSEVTEADQWQINGGQSGNYELPIDIPAGYVWNADANEVAALTSVWGRPADNMWWKINGTPWVDGAELIVPIHVGCKGWLGGPKVFMQAKAGFVPDPNAVDPEYQQEYQQWLLDVQEWEAGKAAALEGPRLKAEAEADAFAQTTIATLDPVAELMSQIAAKYFLGEMSDEHWEVDFWGQVFDWSASGFSVYPGWYTKRPARDSLRSAHDFLNASWAKLYLPVRPGYERLALRWIVARVRDAELDPATEAAITRIVDELNAFRLEVFGDANETRIEGTDGAELTEQFVLLARWNELLPTDGTHVEVVQGMTSAADDFTRMQLQDTRNMLVARIDGELQDVQLKKRALDQIGAKGPANVEIRIGTEDSHHANHPTAGKA